MKIDRHRAEYIYELRQSSDPRAVLELLKEMVSEEMESARNITRQLRLSDLYDAIDLALKATGGAK